MTWEWCWNRVFLLTGPAAVVAGRLTGGALCSHRTVLCGLWMLIAVTGRFCWPVWVVRFWRIPPGLLMGRGSLTPVRGRTPWGTGVSHIYSVNVDGTAQTQLSSSDVRDWRPGWSPDSERIVFQRLSGTGRDDNGRFVEADRYVVLMDADGSNRIALTEGGHWEQSPAWSPDGTRIAYLSDNLVGIVDSDGTNPTGTPTGGAFWDGGVSWSPDGKRLAFARTEGDGSSIVVVDIEGLIEETVTDAEGWDTMPRWSPDGQKLLFTRKTTRWHPAAVCGGCERPTFAYQLQTTGT